MTETKLPTAAEMAEHREVLHQNMRTILRTVSDAAVHDLLGKRMTIGICEGGPEMEPHPQVVFINGPVEVLYIDPFQAEMFVHIARNQTSLEAANGNVVGAKFMELVDAIDRSAKDCERHPTTPILADVLAATAADASGKPN